MTFYLLFAADTMATMSGNDWKQLPATARQGYVIGVVDTWSNLAQAIEPTGKPSTSEVLKIVHGPHRLMREGARGRWTSPAPTWGMRLLKSSGYRMDRS